MPLKLVRVFHDKLFFFFFFWEMFHDKLMLVKEWFEIIQKNKRWLIARFCFVFVFVFEMHITNMKYFKILIFAFVFLTEYKEAVLQLLAKIITLSICPWNISKIL